MRWGERLMPITVYGASDDTIVVGGDIAEEFPYQRPGYGQPSGDLLAVSDGTILRIDFTREGIWRIAPVVHGSGMLSIEQAPEGDDRNYSDRATLLLPDGPAWVVHGIDWAKADA